MFLYCRDDHAPGEAECEQCRGKSAEPAHGIKSNGQKTTRVRVPQGKRLVIDGPFAETREQLGG
jgi:hypothetical protein